MPSRRFTSGRKFSTTTSAFLTIFLSTATPSGDLRFSVMLRLLRCRFWKSEPSRGPPRPSPDSICGGISILMTLAPQSASWRTQVGPDRTRVRSSTVKRARAFEARGKGIAGVSAAGLAGVILPAASPTLRRAGKGQNFPDLIGVVHRLDGATQPVVRALQKRYSSCRQQLPPTAIFPALSGGDHERGCSQCQCTQVFEKSRHHVAARNRASDTHGYRRRPAQRQ